jgi:hypothetical protein
MRRFLLAVTCFTVIAANPASNPAMARGTNMHEMASSRHDSDPSVTGSIGFMSCGHGRYRHSHTDRCVRPADFRR